MMVSPSPAVANTRTANSRSRRDQRHAQQSRVVNGHVGVTTRDARHRRRSACHC